MTALILAYPTDDGKYVLDTDASHKGFGAILPQVQGSLKRVIAYYSWAMSSPERNNCMTRKELLAMLIAMTYFHSYLYGRNLMEEQTIPPCNGFEGSRIPRAKLQDDSRNCSSTISMWPIEPGRLMGTLMRSLNAHA